MAAERNKKQNDNEKSLIHSFDMLLIMSILKMYTGDKKAFSIPEITELLNDMFAPVLTTDYGIFADRTIYRKLDLMTSSYNTEGILIDYINSMLLMLTGGTVRYRAADGIVNGNNTTGKGSQKRYYFEPLLTNSDLDMICSALMSSRYLSEDEKNYLLARLSVLKSGYDEADRDLIRTALFGSLPLGTPSPLNPLPVKSPLPSENSMMLSHIMTVYEAIQNEYQLEVIYGMYDFRDRSSRVDFHPRNADKPYILNPYAMMWNEGEYYLIATHKGYENPVHFRIDRIIDAKIHTKDKKSKKNGSMIRVPVKRNKIPASLTQFFHRRNNRRVFDSIAYTNKYPSMKIYGRENLTDCCFECTDISLQILIDCFGTGIRLGRTPVIHPENEVDINGRPLHYITATVTGVQLENAIDFAVEHSNTLTLLSPDELVKEVRDRIRAMYEKYL